MARRARTSIAVRRIGRSPIVLVRPRELARTVKRRVARGARGEVTLATAMIGSAALGWAQKGGVSLPQPIPQLSVPATYGLLAWGIDRFVRRNALARDLATGWLSVAAYEFGRGAHAGTQIVFGDEE